MEELMKLITSNCREQTVTIPMELAVQIVMELEKLRRIREALKGERS